MAQIVLVGDSRVRTWDAGRNFRGVAVFAFSGMKVDELIARAKAQVTSSTRKLVIVALHNDLTTIERDRYNLEYKGLLTVRGPLESEEVLHRLAYHDANLKDLYAGLEIYWVLPAVVDFLRYNLQQVRKHQQDEMSTREQYRSIRDARIFATTLVNFKRGCEQLYPEMHLIDIHMLLEVSFPSFTAIKRGLVSLPQDFTVDGVHFSHDANSRIMRALMNVLTAFSSVTIPEHTQHELDVRARKRQRRRERYAEKKARSKAFASMLRNRRARYN